MRNATAHLKKWKNVFPPISKIVFLITYNKYEVAFYIYVVKNGIFLNISDTPKLRDLKNVPNVVGSRFLWINRAIAPI